MSSEMYLFGDYHIKAGGMIWVWDSHDPRSHTLTVGCELSLDTLRQENWEVLLKGGIEALGSQVPIMLPYDNALKFDFITLTCSLLAKNRQNFQAELAQASTEALCSYMRRFRGGLRLPEVKQAVSGSSAKLAASLDFSALLRGDDGYPDFLPTTDLSIKIHISSAAETRRLQAFLHRVREVAWEVWGTSRGQAPSFRVDEQPGTLGSGLMHATFDLQRNHEPWSQARLEATERQLDDFLHHIQQAMAR